MSRPHARAWMLAAMFAAGFGLGAACTVIAEPETVPCESGSNNLLDDNGVCVCRPGYEFCNPEDPMNLDCCEPDMVQLMPCESGMNNKLDDNGDCVCQFGYEWCSPADASDLNCCESGAGTAETG